MLGLRLNHKHLQNLVWRVLCSASFRSLCRSIDPGITFSPYIALTSEERSTMFSRGYQLKKLNKVQFYKDDLGLVLMVWYMHWKCSVTTFPEVPFSKRHFWAGQDLAMCQKKASVWCCQQVWRCTDSLNPVKKIKQMSFNSFSPLQDGSTHLELHDNIVCPGKSLFLVVIQCC